MNHMAEVAKMLGVELGEPFIVGDYKYHFTEKGLCCNDVPDSNGSCVWMLYYLLNGTYTIQPKPWKPNNEERYWYVDERGRIWSDYFDYYSCMSHCMNYYKLGNCYHTKEEAEANRDKWVKFYASDEILEV